MFQKNLDESGNKPNKVLLDKGSGFYNKSLRSWLAKHDMEMCSAHNEGNSVVTTFIRTLKSKIYKYITSILKNVYIDKLGDIVKKSNNAYHRTTKMKSVDVKSEIYVNFNKQNNYKDPKFKVCN